MGKMKVSDKKRVAGLWAAYLAGPVVELRDELIVEYLYLIKFVVGRVASGLPSHIKLDDLYSSGASGLIRAVERFDPSKNAKFESYAMLLIKGSIIDELRRLDWIPRSVHQKATEISKVTEDLARNLGREPSDAEISDHLGITEEEFSTLLARIRPAILISLDADFTSDEESMPIAERIADREAKNSFEIADRKEFYGFLEEAVSELPAQEKQVLVLYYFEELMLKEIGHIMGVSESRVSQIHTKAILRLRSRLSNFRSEYGSEFAQNI